MNEEIAAQNYLMELLEADDELSGMIGGVAWRTSWSQLKSPFVKMDRQDASDLMVVGLDRVWVDLTFLVRGVEHWRGSGQPDWGTVREISDRIDELLHDHEGTDGTVSVHVFREETYTDETVEGGDLWLHAGGIYRVRAQAA